MSNTVTHSEKNILFSPKEPRDEHKKLSSISIDSLEHLLPLLFLEFMPFAHAKIIAQRLNNGLEPTILQGKSATLLVMSSRQVKPLKDMALILGQKPLNSRKSLVFQWLSC